MPLVSRRMQDVRTPIVPWAGEPARHTPPAPFRRGRARHEYRKTLGIPALRERIAVRLAAEDGIDPDRFSPMVTAGGNMACLTVLLASGDRDEAQDAA